MKNKTIQEISEIIEKLIKLGYSKEYIGRIIEFL